jgi:hypothetical protein
VQTDSEKIIQRRVKIFWTIVVIVTVSAVIFIINNNFVHHPLWHWLKLLIVPAVLAGGDSGSTHSRESVSNRRRTIALKTRHCKHIWMGWQNC